MTVAGIIEQFNTERPNTLDDTVKVNWLKKFEQMVINEVIIQHDHDLEDENKVSLIVKGSTLKITPAGSLSAHIDSFGMDSELIIKEPYDDVYIHYLDQRLASMNNDTKRYNVASQNYNNAYYAFQQYFNRTFKTKSQPKKLLRHEVL